MPDFDEIQAIQERERLHRPERVKCPNCELIWRQIDDEGYIESCSICYDDKRHIYMPIDVP